MKNQQNIVFYPSSKLVKNVIPAPKPVTAPTWFKTMPLYTNKDQKLIVKDGTVNYTVKRCVPFLDTFSTGYTINLWCDVQVRIENNLPVLSWNNLDVELNPIFSGEGESLPTWDGFYPSTLSWVSKWGVKTPKGYSCLFTHPLNRTDLPFLTTTGIMDTDGWGIWGNQPFFLRKDFEGIIPAGTPLIQIIPFKRESWVSSIDEKLTEWANYENVKRTSLITGYYKKYFWNKKNYS